ncbi:MAG TPA: hypothetical protein VFS43_16910 [Polyangiaceae bacterium]|nr:hypothetical protein [Polyangiaceae bacterium]
MNRPAALLAPLFAALVASCVVTDRTTQITLAFTSEAKPVDEFDALSVRVFGGDGAVAYDVTYPAEGQGFLPATFDIVPKGEESFERPLRVEVRAEKGGELIVERRAVISYVKGRSLLLPMPLRMACFAMTCGGDPSKTCVGGVCRDLAVDTDALPEFDARYVIPERAVGECFDEGACLAGSRRVAVAIDDCTFPLPPGLDVNVSIRWEAAPSRVIVLDGDDPGEGWERVDDATGRLSPGVCTAVLQPFGGPDAEVFDKALDVWVSTACPAKRALQAFCRASPAEAVGVGAELDPGALPAE